MTLNFKTIFISDMHLGSKQCSDKELLLFLLNSSSEELFLIGDCIDGFQLKRKFYWPESHNNIIASILKKSRQGTKVRYITGNHDDFLRSYTPFSIGDIDIIDEYIYNSNGRSYFLTHGDMYDAIVRYHKTIAALGSLGYDFLVRFNKRLNSLRYKFGMKYWSLSDFIKKKVKRAASFITEYETMLVSACKEKQCDAVISGHIHHAEIRKIDEILYMNDGDFSESRTALVENLDGSFSILTLDGTNLYELVSFKNDDIIHHTKPLFIKKL